MIRTLLRRRADGTQLRTELTAARKEMVHLQESLGWLRDDINSYILEPSLPTRLKALASIRRPLGANVTSLAADGEPPVKTPEDLDEILELEDALAVVLDDLSDLNAKIKGCGKAAREALEPQRRHLLRRMKRLQGALDRGGPKELQRERIVIGRMFATFARDDAEFHALLGVLLDLFLTSPRDREFFGLSPTQSQSEHDWAAVRDRTRRETDSAMRNGSPQTPSAPGLSSPER